MSVPTLSFRERGAAFQSITLDRLIASRALIQANSGGGKSRALRFLAEQTHGKVQQIILDPEGEFSSLRESFDYVLAGRDGDVPAEPGSAKLLCRRIMELGVSCVIDLYDLKLPDRRRFVRLFLEELMHLPQSLRRPLIVVIDEAHIFAPESGSGSSESLEAVTTLATQGRKRGYCLIAATQRLSKLHKDVAAELLNKLVGRTGLDVDLKRAGDELGMGKDERAALKHLAPGTFYAYGPAIANEVTIVRTGDVKTSHPEVGKIGAPAPPAPKAIQKLLSELKDLPAQAKEEARTVEDLQRKLRETRGQLRKAERGITERVVEKPVRDEVGIRREVDRALAAQRRELEARTRKTATAVKSLIGPLANFAERLSGETIPRLKILVDELAAPIGGERENGGSAPPVEIKYPVRAETLRPRREIDSRNDDSVSPITNPQQRILDALASFEALGLEQVQKSNIAVFADQSPRSSGFANNLGSLRSAGLIEYPQGGFVSLTDTGRAAAAVTEPISSAEQLHEAWYAKLPNPQAFILRQLVEVHPDAIERNELAAKAGQSSTSSGYANNLGALRSLGLIEYEPGRRVVATGLLFPAGLT